MASTSTGMIEDATTLLERLTKEQREYLLFRLVSEKLEDERSIEPIPVHRPDGSLLGYIRPLAPPSQDDETSMHDRAKRVDPKAGRPTHDLLERMRAGDVESVRKFIHG